MLGIDLQERPADVLREGEGRLPAALRLRRRQVVVEDAADAAHLLAVRQVEILLAPLLVARVVGDRVRARRPLHGGMERHACRRPPGCAAGPARASGRRRRRTTTCDVTTMRVFMCAVGTCGLRGWAISDTPEAQKRGSSSAPGICLRNSGANSPCTVEVWMPAFSNTRPRIRLMTPPPPSAPRSVIGARPGRAHEACRRPVRQRRARRQVRLQPLEGRAQLVAQRLEPGARALLLLRQRIVGFSHARLPTFLVPKARAGAADWRVL